MTASVSVQLYSFGSAVARDPDAVAARLASLGVLGVEPVAGTGAPAALRAFGAERVGDEAVTGPTVDPAALRGALDRHGLVRNAAHVYLPAAHDAAVVFDEQGQLGNRTLITPCIFDVDAGAMETFADLDRIKRLADRFNTVADLARARGMLIGYHNHFWEFGADFDGRTGDEVFFDLVEPDVVAEIDVYWAQVGGRDPAELVGSVGEHATMLHLKDGAGVVGAPNTALGTGILDVPAILATAKHASWHVLELEGLAEDAVWPVLEESYRCLMQLGFSRGRDAGADT